MSQQRTCAICGAACPPEELHEFDGQELCQRCLEEETLHCRHCHERIWQTDNAGTEDLPLCQDCRDDYYTVCCHCGALLHESSTYYADDDDYDEHPYCASCYQMYVKDNPIHDYYYKPEPLFYGEGPRFFGVELEIDGGGEVGSKARALLEIANREREYFYIKHDGSHNDGLELVTHPLALEVHLLQVPWDDLCREAAALGYTGGSPI